MPLMIRDISGLGSREWKTKDGRRMRWCDMTVSHLRNVANMLERNTHAAVSDAFRFASTVVGEMASYHLDQVIDDLILREDAVREFVWEIRAYANWRAERDETPE
jgi:hypothetical protein